MTKDYNTHTFANGLRVIHLHCALPVLYCGYAVGAGTRDEDEGKEGMAHFCEHVMFKGTARRRPWHIINCLESVGGDLNAFTGKEETVYHAAVLRANVDRAVDILTDMVFHSTCPQHEIDKEVEVICDEIESYNDSPAELIYDIFEDMLFHGHPLGRNILGSAERLRTFTTHDALAFTGRHYRPDNAVFFAYGDISFTRLVAMLRRAHGIAPGEPLLPCPAAAETLRRNRRTTPLAPYLPTHREKVMNTHQTHVMLANRAYAVGDERRMPLYLMNNMLGGPGMNARLNLSLRERHALVYTVESFVTSYGDTGLWGIYFGCDPHDTKRCLRLVRRELDRFMRQPLTPSQLAAAKRQIKGQIGVACDSRESFALDFAKVFLHYGVEKDMTALYAQIDAVTADDMQRVAQELFDEERLTLMEIK